MINTFIFDFKKKNIFCLKRNIEILLIEGFEIKFF